RCVVAGQRYRDESERGCRYDGADHKTGGHGECENDAPHVAPPRVLRARSTATMSLWGPSGLSCVRAAGLVPAVGACPEGVARCRSRWLMSLDATGTVTRTGERACMIAPAPPPWRCIEPALG